MTSWPLRCFTARRQTSNVSTATFLTVNLQMWHPKSQKWITTCVQCGCIRQESKTRTFPFFMISSLLPPLCLRWWWWWWWQWCSWRFKSPKTWIFLSSSSVVWFVWKPVRAAEQCVCSQRSRCSEFVGLLCSSFIGLRVVNLSLTLIPLPPPPPPPPSSAWWARPRWFPSIDMKLDRTTVAAETGWFSFHALPLWHKPLSVPGRIIILVDLHIWITSTLHNDFFFSAPLWWRVGSTDMR